MPPDETSTEEHLRTELDRGNAMSKYDALWEYLRERDQLRLILTFDEVEKIAGVPLDHSFLRCKSELLEYGFEVGGISLKNKTILFIRQGENR